MLKNDFKTTHNLDFKTADYKSKNELPIKVNRFNIGTCFGVYGTTKNGYHIYSVINRNIGNGHFEDVLEWFEFSCKRDNGSLVFVDVKNDRLKKHLIEKRGFVLDEERNLTKHFDVLLSAK